MNFEETKKKYEDEIHRLGLVAQDTQKKYQDAFDGLEKQKQALLSEYNDEIQRITIGIERLRGAYTALCDMEEGKDPTLVANGMLQDYEIPEQETTPDTFEETVEEVVEENPAVETNPISDEVKEMAHKAVKAAVESGNVTKYEDFAKSDLGKETALSDEEIAALTAVTKGIEEKSEDNTPKTAEVKAEDVPDYLKDQYGLK